jgi:hypothetical protein
VVLQHLLQYCRAQAIADALEPTEESIWREACREYSKAFHTPLQTVLKMDMEHVLLHNFEHQLSDVKIDENVDYLLEQVYKIENPDYDKEEEADLQEYIKKVQSGEIGKKRKKPPKKLLPEKQGIPAGKPTAGSVDFSHLKGEG